MICRVLRWAADVLPRNNEKPGRDTKIPCEAAPSPPGHISVKGLHALADAFETVYQSYKWNTSQVKDRQMT